MKSKLLQPTSYKLITIVGPTASGKSELAVQLAKKFNGEIISCDSRQVYKGLNIGTGKVAGHWKTIVMPSHPERSANRRRVEGSIKKDIFVYKNIPHHLIDVADPKKQYSVAQFKKAADKAVKDILKRGKLPILCGGTGQYVDAVVFNQALPNVKPNKKLRKELEAKSSTDLFEQLKKLDPERAKTIDSKNPRRLIRALEIVLTTGSPVPFLTASPLPLLPALWLGINPSQETLYKKIDRRLKLRLKEGMLTEAQKLHRQGLSYKRMEELGLEYKYEALVLQKKLTEKEMLEQLSFAIKHYAKRQMTWFKRNKDIHWVKNFTEASRALETFLK